MQSGYPSIHPISTHGRYRANLAGPRGSFNSQASRYLKNDDMNQSSIQMPRDSGVLQAAGLSSTNFMPNQQRSNYNLYQSQNQ